MHSVTIHLIWKITRNYLFLIWSFKQGFNVKVFSHYGSWKKEKSFTACLCQSEPLHHSHCRAYTLGTTKSLGLTTICPVTFLIASVFKNIISVKLTKFSLTSVYLFRTGMPQSDLYYWQFGSAGWPSLLQKQFHSSFQLNRSANQRNKILELRQSKTLDTILRNSGPTYRAEFE